LKACILVGVKTPKGSVDGGENSNSVSGTVVKLHVGKHDYGIDFILRAGWIPATTIIKNTSIIFQDKKPSSSELQSSSAARS